MAGTIGFPTPGTSSAMIRRQTNGAGFSVAGGNANSTGMTGGGLTAIERRAFLEGIAAGPSITGGTNGRNPLDVSPGVNRRTRGTAMGIVWPMIGGTVGTNGPAGIDNASRRGDAITSTMDAGTDAPDDGEGTAG